VIDDDFKSPELLEATVDESDQLPNINGTVIGTIGVGDITVPAAEALDAATELGSISSAATAVSNNLSIDSDTSLQLHLGQFGHSLRGCGAIGPGVDNEQDLLIGHFHALAERHALHCARDARPDLDILHGLEPADIIVPVHDLTLERQADRYVRRRGRGRRCR
jgi:hypothetical protein